MIATLDRMSFMNYYDSTSRDMPISQFSVCLSEAYLSDFICTLPFSLLLADPHPLFMLCLFYFSLHSSAVGFCLSPVVRGARRACIYQRHLFSALNLFALHYRLTL